MRRQWLPLLVAGLCAIGGARAVAEPKSPEAGPVRNASTALGTMAAQAGASKLDDVMIEFFDPEGTNIGGHVALSIRDPDSPTGRLVFNISKPDQFVKRSLKERVRLLFDKQAQRARDEQNRGKMVHISTDATGQLFGAKFEPGAQGGIYNRSTLIVGIADVADRDLRKMVARAQALRTLDQAGKLRFSGLTSPVRNKLGVGGDVEWGNCSTFVGEVLAGGGIDVKSQYPKKTAMLALERQARTDPDGTHVYFLLESGKKAPRRGPVSIFDLPRMIKYWRHEQLADVTVHVDPLWNRAVIRRASPPKWRAQANRRMARSAARPRAGR